MTDVIPTRRQCANHEAGHVAMAVLCGARVKRAVLKSEPSRAALCSLAGFAAEQILSGKRRWLFGYRNGSFKLIDDQDILAAFLQFKRSPIAASLLRCHWQGAVIALRMCEPGLRSIASELNRNGRISGARVHKIMQAEMKRNARGIRHSSEDYRAVGEAQP